MDDFGTLLIPDNHTKGTQEDTIILTFSRDGPEARSDKLGKPQLGGLMKSNNIQNSPRLSQINVSLCFAEKILVRRRRWVLCKRGKMLAMYKEKDWSEEKLTPLLDFLNYPGFRNWP